MSLKRTKFEKRTNRFDEINQQILGHILGYVGLKHGAISRNVCKKFKECKQIVPHIMCNQHWIKNGLIKNVMKMIDNNYVFSVTFLKCNKIEKKDLEFTQQIKFLKNMSFIECVGTDNMLRRIDNGLKIYNVTINRCDVTDVGISHLSKISGLMALIAINCKFTGATMYMLKELIRLNLWGCRNFNVKYLEELTGLRALSMFCSNRECANYIIGLKNLHELYLGNWEELGVLNLNNIIKLTNLNKLIVSRWHNDENNNTYVIDLFIFRCVRWEHLFAQHKRLESLHIKELVLTSEIMTKFTHVFSRLKYLNIDTCIGTNLNILHGIGAGKLKGLCLSKVPNLRGISGFIHLEELTIGCCELYKSDVDEIIALKKLRTLFLCQVLTSEENVETLREFMEERIFVCI